MADGPETTTIIGIDPGYAITGYGIVSKTGNKIRCVDYGAITTPPKMAFPERLLAINEKMRFLLEMYKPDHMAIEELFLYKNTTTAIGTAQARGVVIVEAARANIPVYEFTPGEVKLAVTGYGKAQKQQVAMMTKTLLGLKEMPKPDDVTDALAIAITLAHTGPKFSGQAVSGYQYGRYGYADRAGSVIENRIRRKQ